jgi:hypothetical protein
MANIWAIGRLRPFILIALIAAACGQSAAAATEGPKLCAAILSLGPNHADFMSIQSATQAEAAYAALDRMTSRTQAALDALRAIRDPAIATIANDLAAAEGGLLPILAQFKAVRDQASWSAAVDAYTQWNNGLVPVVTGAEAKLERAGVHCDLPPNY